MINTLLPTINEFKQVALIKREHNNTITSHSASLNLLSKEIGYKKCVAILMPNCCERQ